MSSSENPNPLNQQKRNLSLSERKTPSKFRLPLRSLSEPRFNTWQKFVGERDVFKSSSFGLPKLALSKGKPRVTGVVKLNTACERKYRSWSDQPEEFAGDRNFFSHTGTFYEGVKSNPVILPRLTGKKEATRCSFEEKSCCDTISTFPCSSITGSSMYSLDIPDDREVCFISKRKTVLNWIDNVELEEKMAPCE